MIIPVIAGERLIEKEIEDFLYRDGWAIETQGGDHLAIQYGNNLYDEPEIILNVTKLARHLAECCGA